MAFGTASLPFVYTISLNWSVLKSNCHKSFILLCPKS